MILTFPKINIFQNQFFSRIYVKDISSAIIKSMKNPTHVTNPAQFRLTLRLMYIGASDNKKLATMKNPLIDR